MLTLRVFQSFVGSVHFFWIECLKPPASIERMCWRSTFYFLFEFSECFLILYYFRDVALGFLQIAFCGLLPVEPVFLFDPRIFCLLSLTFPPCFQLYIFLLFRGFLLLYCCPYLLIFGLEPEVWLGVLLSFLRLLCLRYLTWSVISFFFHSMHMLKSLSIWPSGIFFTFLLHLVLHICFHSVRHFNTFHNHFWFCKGWLLGYFWHSQKSCRNCTGKGELVNFIHNGSEITTWVECRFRSKSTKSKATILR